MRDNGFKKGKLTYNAASGITPAQVAELVAGSWKGGYVAFANGEKRLDELGDIQLNAPFLTDRVTGCAGVEGYVTELNVWRSDGRVLEEIAVEREDNSYYVQTFHLDMCAQSEENCLYREAATKAGSHHKDGRRIYSGELKTVEVVWPEKRLNIFITRGNQ